MNQVYLSDIPRLFTAVAEWCACLVFLRKQPLRFSGPRLWGTLGLGLVIQCLFLCFTDGLHIVLWLPCMMGAVGLMFALIAVCCNAPLASVGYFTACAFLTAEFAASLEWQLWSYARHTLKLPQGAWSTIALSLICLAVVYAGVFEVIRRLTGRREDPPAAFVFRAGELWPPLVISAACFFMSNLSFVYSNTPFSSSAIESIYNIRTLMDLAGVAMLYAYHVQRRELYMQRELDTLLTGKSLYCARHGVELTCVADGARLGFMDVMDICSIFGNILDNAIEYELTLSDKKKRLIHLAVYAKRDFLVIQCENYCEEQLEFQDGLPVSTKGDGAYHGYGIKSIRYTAEKYGGTMTIHNRDRWFEMNIVIPIPEPVV